MRTGNTCYLIAVVIMEELHDPLPTSSQPHRSPHSSSAAEIDYVNVTALKAAAQRAGDLMKCHTCLTLLKRDVPFSPTRQIAKGRGFSYSEICICVTCWNPDMLCSV